MIRLQSIFDIARQALNTQQAAMNVTGYNIANASRPEYSRQRVVIGAKDPLNLPHAVLGTGVEVETIKRIRDYFIDKEIRNETSGLGKWEYQEQLLHQIEIIFNEPSETGLNNLLSQFWESWQDLADNPENQAARTGIQQKAIMLTNSFNRLDSQLRKLQKNLDDELKLKVEEINTLARQIADLNRQIVAVEVGGNSANDYRDRRDSLLTQLSKLTHIDYKESEDGSVTVMMGKSSLVERENSRELTTTIHSTGKTSFSDIIWKDSGKDVTITDGELKGITELRDTQIPESIRKLDELALGLVEQINRVHRTGYGLNGLTGNDFFDAFATGAGDIALSDAILNDVKNIAASSTGDPGDNSNALSIYALRNSLVMNQGATTFGDYYSSMIGVIGVHSQEAQSMRKNQELLVSQLENQQKSISGVSLDEEMTHMIEYQHAFNAAAKLVVTVDEMMQTVLNMI